jgi:beta-galactosidase
MAAVKRYVERLSKEVTALQCINGGPILMVQVENEYGSYANDRTYLETLRKLWISNGIKVPFYTADGPTAFMLEAGNLDGCAIGLDSGGSDADFAQAEKHQPGVPAFSSESYPGWLTHWKEPWQRPDTAGILKELDYLLSHKRSFNLYVVHGGTNFGYNAGANAFTPVQFQPDVTSYDYDAPIDEQGRPSPKFFAIQRLITKYTGHTPPALPAAIPVIEIPAFPLHPFASLWQHLPAPIRSPQPLPMEMLDQSEGFILYRTKLIGHKSGSLTITEPHDYAMVFLNGVLIDTIFRDGGKWTIKLPETKEKDPLLEILVESMGHINFAQYMIDRKGITDRVTLNGMTLMNWEIFRLPMSERFIRDLEPGRTAGPGTNAATLLAGGSGTNAANISASGLADSLAKRPGLFFQGVFQLNEPADTYLDLSHYHMGVIWVNGHNLGRYWNAGPQFRLYCPAPWLKKGKNEVLVFDLHQLEAAPLRGVKTLDGETRSGASDRKE